METKIYVSLFALVTMSLCLNVKGTTVMDTSVSTTPPSHPETASPRATSVGVSTQSVPEKNSTSGNVNEKTPVTSSVNQTDPSNTTLGPVSPSTLGSPTTLSSNVSHFSTDDPKVHSLNSTNTTSPANSSSLRPNTTSANSSTIQPSSTQSPALVNSTHTQPKPTLSPESTNQTNTTAPAVPQSVPQPWNSISTQPPLASTLTNSPSALAKTHTDAPSQLSVVNGQPPTLDPLLAGLVSGFIVTAALISLLLFIKMRRQNQRPAFRRLQDLPMDDMMEDTPLSMYSY